MNTNLPSSTHFKSYPQKIITNMPVYTKSLFSHIYATKNFKICSASPSQAAPQHSKIKKVLFYFAMHSVCTTLLREVRLRLGRKNENFLIFILFFARLALTLHPETQRTDLAACNLSKIMLKLNVVHCAAKQCIVVTRSTRPRTHKRVVIKF